MTLTATDLFCGAGGSSLGARNAGVELVMAANHWQVAIDVHQQHFPDAAHDLADISQVDPRRYPVTNVLMASPECTNHSQARGVSRKRQDPSLWDAPDPAAERSRATMWDVPKFAEQNRYDFVVTENVVEAAKWVGWRGWHAAMEDIGYEHRVLSVNAQFHGVPQSRDRMYVVFWRKGIRINLDHEADGWCQRCEAVRACVQTWKNGRTLGRYRQQWLWSCLTCGREARPAVRGAVDIIDRSYPMTRIGDRVGKDALVANTRARIAAGILKYWPDEFQTAGAGNTYETTPGNRSRPTTDPLPVQQTTATQALVVPHRTNGQALPVDRPIGTVTANGNHHGLVMRNNSGGAEMVTPATEPLRTLTTAGHQSLLMPYYGNGTCRPADDPMPTVTTKDRLALIDVERLVDDCDYRMFEPPEIAAGMDFPPGYIPTDLPKKAQVKLAGNGNPPAVEEFIMRRIVEAASA